MLQQEETNAAAAFVEKGEKDEVIIAHIYENLPAWAEVVQDPEQIEIRQLSGLSNACYRVALKSDVELPLNS